MRYEKPAGLLVTGYVYIVYLIALRFEGYVLVVDLLSDLTLLYPLQPFHGHDLHKTRGRKESEVCEEPIDYPF